MGNGPDALLCSKMVIMPRMLPPPHEWWFLGVPFKEGKSFDLCQAEQMVQKYYSGEEQYVSGMPPMWDGGTVRCPVEETRENGYRPTCSSGGLVPNEYMQATRTLGKHANKPRKQKPKIVNEKTLNKPGAKRSDAVGTSWGITRHAATRPIV